jgi:hypothetical protein
VSVAAGQATGAFTLAAGAFDITNTNTTGAKLSAGDSSNYSVTVTNPPPPSDTTPPVISHALNPPAPNGANGWYNTDVTLTWTVTENESSSSLVKTGCVDQSITTDQAATTYSCSATSQGGAAGPENVTIKRDATPPSVTWNGGPGDGGNYYFGSVPTAGTCTASDALSGPNNCNVGGYSAAVGSHTLTATAHDNAGNETQEQRSYSVLAWTLLGFYQPTDMGGVLNTVKGGSTVPLKFEAFAGPTELADTAAVKSLAAKQVTCDTAAPTDDVEVTATGGTALRYDATGGQFIYNWQTPKQAGNCYVVTMTTQDGSTLVAKFKTK